MSERIGFIGLGNMGRPMAGQVIAKGFSTTVFDLSEAPMEILRQKGATRAASIPAVIANSDVIVTMLPNTPDVQGVVLGEGGLLAAGRPGMLHIDMSTIDPLASKAMAAALAAKGIGWVDAGVGRSPAHADRGESSFMVGATDSDLARARPVLEAMGRGCPVICSRVASLPEVGGDAAWWCEMNAASYLAAVRECARNGPTRAACVSAGPAQARKFSWAKCAAGTVDVYRSVLGGSAAGT